jgi:predicted nucleic acid-binding protein
VRTGNTATEDIPTLVVDASVVVKWLLPEDGQSQAYYLQDLYADEKLNLIAPPILIAEVGSALARRCRRSELSAEAARLCFSALIENSPVLLHFTALESAAFDLALAHGRPIYDCFYLALALHHQCGLVTADEKFVRTMSPEFPSVRSLKDYAPSEAR